jgi:phage terminase small subunit
MQTINIDGTTYKLKFDRDPLEMMKLARKPYKPKKPKDIRKFPTWLPNMSTAVYIRQFDKLNMLQAVDYIGASETSAAQYDPAIPLFEILPDEVN